MDTAGKIVLETVVDKSGFEEGVEDLDKDSKLDGVLGKILTKFKSCFTKVGKSAGKIGSGFTKLGATITKVMTKIVMSATKFGIAFGVAFGVILLIVGALYLIAQATKKVFDENKQLKADLQYIFFAIKTALEPVINAIAGVIAKIVAFVIEIFKYAMAIANLIAGKNLFEKATPEAYAKKMKEAEKSTKKTGKNVKDIKKQLAGFDEMNVLTDNKSGGGGGSKIDMPSFNAGDLTAQENKIKEIVGKYKKMWEDIQAIDKEEARKTFESQDGIWGTLKFGLFEQFQGIVIIIQSVIDGIEAKFDIFVGLITGDWGKIKEGFIKEWNAFLKFLKGAWEYIEGAWNTVWGLIKGILLQLWVWIETYIVVPIRNVASKVKSWFIEKIVNPIKEGWNNLKTKLSEIWNGIKDGATNIFNSVKTFIIDKVIKPVQDKWTTFKDKVTSIFNGIKSTAVSVINAIIRGMNKLIQGLNKISFDVPSWIPLIGGKKWGFNLKEINEIKLAKGGILNNPGRGVPVGGALAGERGAEGVIPLTDSQQMALLGEAIGKYITINASIINTMNGRVISRELQKIQNENSFAGNL